MSLEFIAISLHSNGQRACDTRWWGWQDSERNGGNVSHRGWIRCGHIDWDRGVCVVNCLMLKKNAPSIHTFHIS